MEAKARVLQTGDCGSLLVARSRAPYVTGCLLPTTVFRKDRLLKTHVDARVHFHRGQAALELDVRVDDDGQQHQFHYVVSYAEHREFLEGLGEASALYLLTGGEHPVALADGRSRSLEQRVYEGGLAVEVSEAVRMQVVLLANLSKATPSGEWQELLGGC